MNRKQRVTMIVRVLLVPFTRNPFQHRDLLLENAKTYLQLRDHKGIYSDLIHKNNQAQTELVNSLIGEIQPDRIGELVELLEKFYPSSELAAHLDSEYGEGLEGYYFNVLLRLSTEMITLRDGKASIKMWETPYSKEEFFPDSSGLYKVELWSEISRIITPDVLIAGYFVQCGIQDVRYLQRLPDNIFLSDTIFSQISRKGLAETHLHMSAGMSYQSVWEAVTDPSAQRIVPLASLSTYQREQREEQKKHSGLLIAGWLRLMMAKYLESARHQEGIEDIFPFFLFDDTLPQDALERKILDFILHQGNVEFETSLLPELMEANVQCLTTLRTRFGVITEEEDLDVLSRGPYRRYQALQISPEFLLLYFALEHIRKFPQHHGFQQVFLCYLRIKNAYFSHKMQSTGMSGLSFFRRYFAEATNSLASRHGEDIQKRQLAYQAAFRNQLHCADLKKLEIKLAPPPPSDKQANGGAGEYRIAIAGQLIEIFHAYLLTLKEQNNGQGETEQPPTLGVIYHLIRGDTYHIPSDMCWALRTPSGPGDVISVIRRRSISFVEGLQYLLQRVPHLSEYVIGLDVASEELYAEPWVYAPVYRKARNRYCTYPIQLETGRFIQNIGFTYHVGEDYHHVVSGLRHIDEVLTHFGYKAGDRLGHGMALQVNLAEWAYNNEVISLPKMEYLENLLWLWSLCSEDSANLLKYLPTLEKEIMALAEELYCNVKGLTPHILWSAYQKKFQALDDSFCSEMERTYFLHSENGNPADLHTQPPSQRSFCARVWQGSKEADCGLPWQDCVWDADKLRLTHHCPIYENWYRKPHFVFTDKEKLSLYQAAQVYMRQKVQRMGVYVETNPTSNLLIGDVRSLQEYPIDTLNDRFLNEVAGSAVLLSVNSDDPLIFNTNVENELALVYHMLLYRGIAREQVIAWIDKIREYGLNSSFIRAIKNRQQQEQELNQIIRSLTMLRKRLIEGADDRWSD